MVLLDDVFWKEIGSQGGASQLLPWFCRIKCGKNDKDKGGHENVTGRKEIMRNKYIIGRE